MKNSTKRKILKILNLLMITLVVLNLIGIIFGIGSKSFAEEDNTGEFTAALAESALLAGVTAAFGGLPLIILTVLKLLILIIGLLLQSLMSLAYSAIESDLDFVSLEDIIFAGTNGASQFLDVNFFKFNTGIETVDIFREAIAKWYYILRLISTSVLLVILIYVGIRMALSTVAQDRAKYKQMFMNWVTSLALLFLLHYIIMFIIEINSTLVNAIKNIPMTNVLEDGSVTKVLGSALDVWVWAVGIEGFFAAIIYLLFIGNIFKFFILYVKRMITVGFLIMISPLITITYSIDKMGDNKAQALNAWLKELSYNILIQPFHCIIYKAFFDAIAGMINENTAGIGAYIFAIVVIKFMAKAEEILRKIFHFEANSMGSIGEAGQNMMNATGKFTKIGMATGVAFSNLKSSGGLKTAKEYNEKRQMEKKAEKQLKKEYKSTSQTGSFKDYKNTDAGQKRLEEIKEENAKQMKLEAEEKRAKKIEKARDKYDKKHYTGAFDEKVKEKFEEKYGPDSYERYQNLAKHKLANGKPTQSALKAQEKLNNIGMQEVNKLSNTPAKKIKGWAKTDYGKLVIAGTRDSAKVATALASGAMAYGAGNNINDAITGGQLGFGLAKGILENSSGTVVKNATEVTEKVAPLAGISATPEEIEKYLNGIYAKGFAGQLDAKPLNEAVDKLKNLIAASSKDGKAQGIRDANELVMKIQQGISNSNIKLNIEELVDELNIDDSEKDNILKEVRNYATTFGESMIYSYQSQGEGFGMDHGEFSRRTAKKSNIPG